MTDTKKLIQGLKDYQSSIKIYRKTLQSGFHDLQAHYYTLKSSYCSGGADQLEKHWRKTVKNFRMYIDLSLNISVLLSERMESLSFYEQQRNFSAAIAGLSNIALSSNGKDQEAAAGTAQMLFNTFLEKMGGDHTSAYRGNRNIFLKNLLNDSKQPAFVRGMIRTRLRKNPNTSYMKSIPGYDVGHRFPDIETPENYRLELSSMNRGRPGIAKRLGLIESIR